MCEPYETFHSLLTLLSVNEMLCHDRSILQYCFCFLFTGKIFNEVKVYIYCYHWTLQRSLDGNKIVATYLQPFNGFFRMLLPAICEHYAAALYAIYPSTITCIYV